MAVAGDKPGGVSVPLSWRVVYGSPGCARAISSRGTSLNPGPESMPSVRANHGGRRACAAGVR